jgi:malonate transporter and related proteins
LISIFNVTIPFFALVLLGYISARTGKLDGKAVGALNTFVLYFALPAMLFRFAAGSPFSSIANPPVFATYAVAGLAVLAVTVVGLRWGDHESWRDAGYGGMCATWSNWGYMGFAIIPALMGSQAIAPMIAAGIADLLIVVSAALATAAQEGGDSKTWMNTVKQSLLGVAKNPLIWAIVAGLFVSGLNLEFVKPVDELLRLLGTAAGPVALFSIGISLFRPERPRIQSDTWIIVVTKLVFHPLLAWMLGIYVFGVGRFEASVILLAAALPTAGSVFLFAERNGSNVERCAAIIMLSTVGAFFSLSAWAWLVQH